MIRPDHYETVCWNFYEKWPQLGSSADLGDTEDGALMKKMAASMVEATDEVADLINFTQAENLIDAQEAEKLKAGFRDALSLLHAGKEEFEDIPGGLKSSSMLKPAMDLETLVAREVAKTSIGEGFVDEVCEDLPLSKIEKLFLMLDSAFRFELNSDLKDYKPTEEYLNKKSELLGYWKELCSKHEKIEIDDAFKEFVAETRGGKLNQNYVNYYMDYFFDFPDEFYKHLKIEPGQREKAMKLISEKPELFSDLPLDDQA